MSYLDELSINGRKGFILCISKVKLGDIVSCYFKYSHPGDEIAFRPSVRTTDIIKNLVVIAIHKTDPVPNRLLLGSNDPNLGLWCISHRRNEFTEKCNVSPNIRDFTHAYWAYPGDIKIASVRKKY